MSVGYGAYMPQEGDNIVIYASLEHIDLPLMAQRKIRVGYTPDVLTEAGTYTFRSTP